MRCRVRGSGFLVLAVLAVATAGTVSAESRLFSVRTSQPNVTIVGAIRNGQQLPVAGQSDGATFFRIDNPAGAVPCSNRFRFAASDGTSVDAPVDLCANNWTLTVAVGGAAQPGPGPVAPGPVSPGPVGGMTVPAAGQPLAIATDDSDVTITDAFLSGQPVSIADRQDPYVEIILPGGAQAFQCSRDLGLALSDGRRIARQVDVCQSNFVVVVSLVGGVPPPAIPPALRQVRPPSTVQPLPPAPVAQMPAPVTPAPPVPQPVAGMQWLFSAPGGAATLAYAIPGAGSGAFNAVCAARSGRATVTLGGSAPEVRPGGSVPVGFAAGAFNRTYTAVGSRRSETDGLPHPVLQIGIGDPLWAALITERAFTIGIGSSPPVVLSLARSSQQVKQFLALCNPQPVAVMPQPIQPPPDAFPVPPSDAFPDQQPPLPPGSIGGRQVSFACDDGSDVNATFSGNTAVVYEPGLPPVVLYQAPSQQGQLYVAGRSQLIGQGEDIYWTRGGGDTRTCSPQ